MSILTCPFDGNETTIGFNQSRIDVDICNTNIGATDQGLDSDFI
jgi:hypothetical protein